jgi:putative PIN family toxin of toxin-antitoxin system
MADDDARPLLVIDTNIVLDLLVFEDPAQAALRDAVQQGQVVWLATPAMRDELERVLTYPQVARRLLARLRTDQEVLAHFDSRSRRVPPAARAPVRCRDPDDQIFIDLAVAHRAELLSKDALVLRLRKRLAALGVVVASQRGAAAPAGP